MTEKIDEPSPARQRFVPRSEFVSALRNSPELDAASFRDDLDTVLDDSVRGPVRPA